MLEADVEVHRGGFALRAAISAAPGEVVAVVGPNGAGKTTLVRALAGELALDAGQVRLGDRVLDRPATRAWVAPEHRRIGVVHQDLLLFPHLRAVDDVAFGLRCQGVPRRKARSRAAVWLDRLGVGHRAQARPADLSGGQAQRVALARALATEPDLLLLDEPLAALDATARPQTRRELCTWLADYAGPTVLITHDPVDALLLADRVVVIEGGAVTQDASLADVAARPRTPYVAELMGTNLLHGTADGQTIALRATPPVVLATADDHHGEVFATISPRAISLHRAEPDSSARNRWPVEVIDIEAHGGHVLVHLAGPVRLRAEVTVAAVAELGLEPGATCWASVKAMEVVVYPR